MNAAVVRADARDLPLPDGCVDLIVTSPPYFGLRSYTDGGEHYEGQIGSEATPAAWLANLLDCTREWMRVLKPQGSIFVNLGDRYASRPGAGPNSTAAMHRNRNVMPLYGEGTPKSLLGLPWRYALGCTDQLGLILRAEIIWAKPNGLPESVTDRVRRSHEQIFHFTKQPRYYSAVDEVREPHTDPRTGRNGAARDFHTEQLSRKWNPAQNAYNPLGKLPGSVWDIPSQPLTVPAHLGIDHFAAFPMELPRRIILGWSPPGVCTSCGEGRRPVTSEPAYVRLSRPHNQRNMPTCKTERNTDNNRSDASLPYGTSATKLTTITGYACACPQPTAPTKPALVVDPFGGTGTTALVAAVLGRTGLSFDLSADYCRLAAWRTTDPGERARAMQVPKPPVQMDGQDALFAL